HWAFRRLIEAALGDEEAWADMIDLTPMGLFQEGLGLTRLEAARVVRTQMEPILTAPYGDVRLSSLFMTSAEMMRAAGRGPEIRSARSRINRRLRSRQLQQEAIENRALDQSVTRSGGLLAKQLVYLERYGR